MIDLLYAVIALILGMAIGRPVIAHMRQAKLGQTVRGDGPQSHLKKMGTPTLGGFIFLIPTTLLGLVIWIANGNPGHLPLLIFVLALAALGFADDRIKIKGNAEGLSVRQKSVALVAIILLFVLYLFFLRPETLRLGLLPDRWVPIEGVLPSILYALFTIFFLYACVNSVNITDGVDGLCTSVTLIVVLALVVILKTAALPSMSAMEVVTTRHLLAALGGALLAFLYYNRHPAQIFMGDFGSLALGGFVSGTLLLMGLPFAFLSLGLIYWVEIASVLIQVLYFRRTGGKRLFRMSPIHHHFELGGWSERRIVWTFSAVTLVGWGLTMLIFGSLLYP